jgi:hypothetical protein
MPSRICINAAFVMVHQGYLVDAGIVRTWRDRRSLCRLHKKVLDRSARQQVPEQLGLLFTLFYRFGHECLAPEGSGFIIYGDTGPQERNSSDYPGLVDYVKHFSNRKFPRTHSDGIGKNDESFSTTRSNTIGQDLAFNGEDLNRIFKRKGPRDQKRGIVVTGKLKPKDVFLLRVPPQNKIRVYHALRHLNTRELSKFQVPEAQVEDYVRALQVAIARKKPLPEDFARAGDEVELPEDADALYQKIAELIDSMLELYILIRPSDWDARAKGWRDSIGPRL